MNYIIQRNDPETLQHHGILGMKWGIRRYQNQDGTWTEEGKKRYRKDANKHTKDISQVQEKGIIEIAGLTIAGAGLAYEAYNVAKLLKRGTIDIGASFVREKMSNKRKEMAEIDVETGLPLKSKQTTSEQDMRDVNPARGSVSGDTRNNCGYCTLAYDMRRRGFDVTAKRTTIATSGEDFYKKYYKNVKVRKIEPEGFENLKSYMDKSMTNFAFASSTHPIEFRKYQKALIHNLENELREQPDGSRGYIGVSWKGGSSGHSMAYEISGGKAYIVDAQIAKRRPVSSLEKLVSSVQYARLDNATPNYEMIKKDGLA